MCGIVGVVRRRATRPVPDAADLVEALDRALAAFAGARRPTPIGRPRRPPRRGRRARSRRSTRALRGVPGRAGPRSATRRPRSLRRRPRRRSSTDALDALERELDDGLGARSRRRRSRRVNAALVRAKDAVWAVARDRLRTAARGRRRSPAPIRRSRRIEAFTLGAGRAVGASTGSRCAAATRPGCTCSCATTASTSTTPGVGRAARRARRRPAVRVAARCARPTATLGFVYKAAAEIGELGDNTAALRAAIRDDELLHLALAADDAEVDGARPHALGERRHHLRGQRAPAQPRGARRPRPARTSSARSTATSTTTPTSRRPTALRIAGRDHHRRQGDPDARVAAASRAGADVAEAFRATVAELRGLGRHRRQHRRRARPSCCSPLRGSGQALYVGLAEDAFVVASEPYGLVEETRTYLRIDGETPADPEQPDRQPRPGRRARRRARPGTLDGIERLAYDGTPLPVDDDELAARRRSPPATSTAATSRTSCSRRSPRRRRRSARRCGASSSSATARSTVRARRRRRCPTTLRARLRDGAIRRVARDRPGHRRGRRPEPRRALLADARPTTPVARRGRRWPPSCPGFGLRDDMSDTLVVAISQSGTTTDTNRTVDLVRGPRRARCVAIVNRRNSDLVDKADGVLYTSDGRDVEMSVRVDQGVLRAGRGRVPARARASPTSVGARRRRPRGTSCSTRCASCPTRWTHVLARRGRDRRRSPSATRPSRRYWAVVGNGAQPHRRRTRCGSSCPSSATSRSPATPPRTRSTSTCRPSR